MLRTLKSKLKILSLFFNQQITGAGNSSAIDLADHGAVAFALSVGTFAFSTVDQLNFTMQESDDGTVFTTVSENDILDPFSGTVAVPLDDSNDDEQTHVIHYRGNKRYVQVAWDITGSMDVLLQVDAIAGHLELQPPL